MFSFLKKKCHICKRSGLSFSNYKIAGKKVKICSACNEYAERRAYQKAWLGRRLSCLVKYKCLTVTKWREFMPWLNTFYTPYLRSSQPFVKTCHPARGSPQFEGVGGASFWLFTERRSWWWKIFSMEWHWSL